MILDIDFDDFAKKFNAGESQIIISKIAADSDGVVTAALKLFPLDPNHFLLESVEGGKKRGRYSAIGLMADKKWVCQNSSVTISEDGKEDITINDRKKILPSLQEQIQKSKITFSDDMPPMLAGWFGYMGYEMIHLIEDVGLMKEDTLEIPDSVFIRPQLMVIFDNVQKEMIIAAPVWAHSGDAQERYQAAQSLIAKAKDALAGEEVESAESDDAEVEFLPNMSREEYCAMVDKAKDYIVEGDVFQVLPSQRFSAKFKKNGFNFYRSLRILNPSPFLFYFSFIDYEIIGSSPEIMVKVDHDKVVIRPLAGTRKRGLDAKEDAELSADLLADPKERAEHLMLIDLGRHDVGKVAKPASVRVTRQMEIEYYSHVMHISSTVEGELDYTKHDLVDALMAGFPAGTVSGAPKIRAMQIINEMERDKRSFYAGCAGYFSASGRYMDMAIMLRTALLKDGTLHLQAGAGVVYDSVAESEYEETINKAKALMKAAEGTK
jgi:anthranilate synthase component 1